jgi:hypothetical protein
MAPADIDIVRWWFFMVDDPGSTDWYIRFYDDMNCLPSSLLYEAYVPAFEVSYEYVCDAYDMPIFDCWAFLSTAFTPAPGVPYWISIQAVGMYEWWCTWGDMGIFLNCPGAFKSAYFGFPDFVPDILPLGGFFADFAFELYEDSDLPCWNISLVGEFNNWGNWGDHWMDPDPEDPSIWTTWITFTNDMNMHGDPDIIDVKFRQDGNWIVNWGAPDFPTGIGYLNGPNIPVPIRLDAPEDTYIVTFNCLTGEYIFERGPEVPLSNWAIALGIILIGAFAVWRFRRI